MKIAFIDDKVSNLSAWLSAMKSICRGHAQLTTCQSVEEFEEALGEGYYPNIVFTDYHIDDRFGTEVIAMLRKRFGKEVYIIAHSSGQERNKYLLEAGADEMIPKHKGFSPSPTLAERFWSVDDLQELCAGLGEEE